MTGLKTSEKEYLLSFLESHYGVARVEIRDELSDELPKNPTDLSFVRYKFTRSTDEPVGNFTLKFQYRVQYLEDVIRLSPENPPSFREGYISQISLSDNQRIRATNNPNLTTESLVDSDQSDELVKRITEHVNFLQSEIKNCQFEEEVQRQIHLIIALIQYSIDNRSSADIQNPFRPLRYICTNKRLSASCQSYTYSKIGHKLDFMSDDSDTIPENLLPYCGKNIKSLVSIVEKCLENHE